MRVITLISKDGDTWALAQRIRDEGHRSLVYINNIRNRGVGNGLVDKHPEQKVLVRDNGEIDDEILTAVLRPTPDYVIVDAVENGFGALTDRIRAKGIPVIGGSTWSSLLELDRLYGIKVMKSVGIGVPKSLTFMSFKEAIKHIEEVNKPYVYRSLGNCLPHTYVPRVAADLIGLLEYYNSIKVEKFELQEKIEGIKIATELWFNGKEAVNINYTIEEKKLLEGEHGPRTSGMGSVVWIGSKEDRLFKDGMGKLVPILKKFSYWGPITLEAIVTEDKLYGLSFISHFNYNSFFVLLEMIKGRVNDFLYGIATGVTSTVDLKSEWGIGVKLCVLPYPLLPRSNLYEETLIQGVVSENAKHIWFFDVQKTGDRLLCAGCSGSVGVVTARGDKVDQWSPLRDAKRRVSRTISNLIIPNVMYRRDIGDRIPDEYEQLKKWRWL